jgi:hypothetical protein
MTTKELQHRIAAELTGEMVVADWRGEPTPFWCDTGLIVTDREWEYAARLMVNRLEPSSKRALRYSINIGQIYFDHPSQLQCTWEQRAKAYFDSL